MSAKMILTLLFMVSLCVVAILGFRALPQRFRAGLTTPANEILVAAMPLPAGTLLRAKDVAWRMITETAEPGYILRPATAGGNPNLELGERARAEVYGAALRTEIQAGDPISRGIIVKPGDRDFLHVVLSRGARAIAIPVATGGASTGILYPGDHVDVILTQTFKNDSPLTRRSVGETVVENLRVLAIDTPDAKTAPPGNSFGRTVTLEVTPEQAERINVAVELGKLSLTLRSITAADSIGGLASGSTVTSTITPIWAGDVSPALGAAMPAPKVSPAEQPAVAVIHGTKAVVMKSSDR
jgi:pilus assembly protein CpaB